MLGPLNVLATPAMPGDPVGPVAGAWLGRKSALSMEPKAALPEVLLEALLPDVLLPGLPGNPVLVCPVVGADCGGAGFCGLKPAAVRLLAWLPN